MIHLTINDQPIEVAEGRTLLEACRAHGIRVPTLCHHPALEAYGACRLCMVEVSCPPGEPRLVASCVHPCEEGAVVRTDTEEVQHSRRITAELLLAGASHTPEITALAEELGVETVRFKMPEENACVLCGLCVRACSEIVGVNAISLIRRGIAKQVSPPFQIASYSCIGCGTCVLVCPTGALRLSDVLGFRSVHPTDSAYSGDGCQVCGDADLSPHFVENVASLFVKAEG
jgi:NADH dehydrogenase/NADH:ubiquinone oxidoreductase subunit G